MYELWIADEVYSAILQSFQNTAAFICENMNGCTMMWSNKNVVMLCIGAPPVVSSERTSTECGLCKNDSDHDLK